MTSLATEQAIVALWDDGWTIAAIADHLGVTRGAAGIVVGDLLRKRDAAKPLPAPPRPAPRPAPPRRAPAVKRAARAVAAPSSARRRNAEQAAVVELVAVPLLNRAGVAEIARQHRNGQRP